MRDLRRGVPVRGRRHAGGVLGKGRFEALGDGDRTRFTLELDFEGHRIGKLFVPLFVRRQAATELPESHANLKTQLESDAVARSVESS